MNTNQEITAIRPIPRPKVERAWQYRMFCPECRWTRDFIGPGSRAITELAFEKHYLAQHKNGSYSQTQEKGSNAT